MPYNDDSSYPFDETPDVLPEVEAEKEAIKAFTLWGVQWSLREEERLKTFCNWWNREGRHMTHPLNLNITY